MIIRILGEAQYDVPDDQRPALDRLDSALVDAVDSGDELAFRTGLAAIIDAVRHVGSPLADDAFAPSELVLPFADSTLEETRQLLAEPSDAAATDHAGAPDHAAAPELG